MNELGFKEDDIIEVNPKLEKRLVDSHCQHLAFVCHEVPFSKLMGKKYIVEYIKDHNYFGLIEACVTNIDNTDDELNIFLTMDGRIAGLSEINEPLFVVSSQEENNLYCKCNSLDSIVETGYAFTTYMYCKSCKKEFIG